jgi:hypothetical protein
MPNLPNVVCCIFANRPGFFARRTLCSRAADINIAPLALTGRNVGPESMNNVIHKCPAYAPDATVRGAGRCAFAATAWAPMGNPEFLSRVQTRGISTL